MPDEPLAFSPDQFSGLARMFPLPNLVMFPHVMQALHIFEPRYRALFEEAIEDDRLIALGVLWALAWTVYVIVAIGGPRGATVGMRAVKIYCVRDLTFDQVGMGKSFLRLVVTSLLGIIWIGSLIDDLFPLWDPKRQMLHDKAVDTVVLRTGT